MINSQMKSYDYYTISATADSYGQQTVTTTKQGSINMALNIASQNVIDTIAYKDAEYFGLTYNSVGENYVIKNGNDMLKVLYVNNLGRYNQVFLKVMP